MNFMTIIEIKLILHLIKLNQIVFILIQVVTGYSLFISSLSQTQAANPKIQSQLIQVIVNISDSFISYFLRKKN